MPINSVIRYQTVAILALFGILSTACLDLTSPEVEAASSSDLPLGRLPQTTQPLHYRLHLRIDPSQEHFTGETTINVQLAEASDTIWLHGNKLDVNSLVATLADGETVEGNYEQVSDIGVARLSFPRELPEGQATLAFQYSAPFNTSLEGLYKVVAGGEDYAFTQFQATSARLVFPGFDEPGFKVPFDISLEVDARHVAVSTTPVEEEVLLDNGNKLLDYQRTKPLPTYLIAFAVGPLDERVGDAIPPTALREEAVPFRAYAVKGKGGQLAFALDNTADIVLAQEEYFGHAYPYEKLAVIAVPDFGAGAMENVGAITYREQYLLQSDATPVAMKQRFLLTHAHELAHQWFGNLVTPEWWDDIWLNEAFATWMATKNMDRLQPEAGYKQRMLKSALSTMEIDRLENTRQIRQPVESHADIGAAFDGITYQKGSAVLSMLEGFIGEDAFKQGIQNHMQRHRHGNADARDFVQAIAATRSDLPKGQVEAAFFSFLEQPGIPLVDMDWQCEDKGASKVNVRQSRYLPLGSSADSAKTWVLPLCIAYVEDGVRRQHCELVEQEQDSFEVTSKACPDYLIPNADAAGYYRWSMSQERWETLLGSELLNDREQLAAANSLSGDFHSGELSGRAYLGLLPALLNTRNPQVLSAPLPDLYLIEKHMLTGDEKQDFHELVADLYRPVYERVSLDKTLKHPDQIRLRIDMLELFALLVQDEKVRAPLNDLANRYAGFGDDGELRPDALDPNIREVALATAVDMEGRQFAELLLAHFDASSNAVLREEILRALTRSGDPEFIDKLRALTLSDKLRDNEVEHVIEPLMMNVETQDETWQWLRSNLNKVVERLPSWSQGRIIENASNFCSRARYEEVKSELSDKISELQRGPRSLAITLEQIQLCAALVEEQAPSVRAALASGQVTRTTNNGQ